MAVFFDILAAIVVALFFAFILVALIGWRPAGREDEGAMMAGIFLFLLFVLPIWAIGLWTAPAVTAGWGGSWLGFFFLGLILALLVLALAPPSRHHRRRRPEDRKDVPPNEVGLEPTPPADPMAPETRAYTAAFWGILVVTLLLIVVAYAVP